MQPAKILLVEDDRNLGCVLEESLELRGFSVRRYADGKQGHSAFLKEPFDLCLIDVMLPVKDGFSLARDIRKVDQDIPIIFLTAKSLKEDRIEGFRIGGDDYITKPFSMEELVLRIQAVLKRSGMKHIALRDRKIFMIGKYSFNYEQRILQYGAERKKLTSKEAELLMMLCLHINQVLEREVALEQIWGENNIFSARSMDVYISKLRKYLGKDETVEIANIHGKGFKLIVRSDP